MHSSVGATIALGSVAALLAGFSAYSGLHEPLHEAGGALALSDTAVVARDANGAALAPRWLNDANILSLLGVMNGRQIAAADVELEGWHSDSARVFAASIARAHAELQQSVDSVVEQGRVAPVASALGAVLSRQLQAQIDSMIGKRDGLSIDRAFVRQQVASQSLMSEYVMQLSSIAERPDVKNLLVGVAKRLDGQLARAQLLQRTLARRDSIVAADSAVARAARAERAERASRAMQRNHQ